MCDGVTHTLTICLRHRQDTSEIKPARSNSSALQMQPFFPCKAGTIYVSTQKGGLYHSSACHPISGTDLSFDNLFLDWVFYISIHNVIFLCYHTNILHFYSLSIRLSQYSMKVCLHFISVCLLLKLTTRLIYLE